MKRVFLSFLAEDKDHVQGVRLLAATPYHLLEFYDESVSTPYDSIDADYIRRNIREKIQRSSITVVLISERTSTSRWVDWELEESEKQGNTIIAMAVKGVTSAVLPALVLRNQLPFWPWDPDRLKKLIEAAP